MSTSEPRSAPLAANAKGAELVAAAPAASKEDPALARTIEALRAECCTKLGEIIDKVTATLAPPKGEKEALVIGALVNQGNPDWDPTRPETSWASRQGALYALMSSASDDA